MTQSWPQKVSLLQDTIIMSSTDDEGDDNVEKARPSGLEDLSIIDLNDFCTTISLSGYRRCVNLNSPWCFKKKLMMTSQ